MPVLKVTRQQLEEQGLTYLVIDQPKISYDVILEVYYWDTQEWQATLCLLAGIGEILDPKAIDTEPK